MELDFNTMGVNETSHELSVELIRERLNFEEVRTLFPLILFYSTILTVGVVGNVVVLIVYSMRYKRSPARVYILFLASIDFSICLFGLPYHLIDLTHPYTFTSGPTCKVLTFVITTLFYMSIFGLIVISVDRYLKICRPLGELQMSNFGKKRSCGAAVFASVLLSWPNIILYGPSEMETGVANVTGYACFYATEYLETQIPFFYSITILSVCIGSTVFLIVIYSLICHQIYKRFSGVSFRKRGGPNLDDTTFTEDVILPCNDADVQDNHSDQDMSEMGEFVAKHMNEVCHNSQTYIAVSDKIDTVSSRIDVNNYLTGPVSLIKEEDDNEHVIISSVDTKEAENESFLSKKDEEDNVICTTITGEKDTSPYKTLAATYIKNRLNNIANNRESEYDQYHKRLDPDDGGEEIRRTCAGADKIADKGCTNGVDRQVMTLRSTPYKQMYRNRSNSDCPRSNNGTRSLGTSVRFHGSLPRLKPEKEFNSKNRLSLPDTSGFPMCRPQTVIRRSSFQPAETCRVTCSISPSGSAQTSDEMYVGDDGLRVHMNSCQSIHNKSTNRKSSRQHLKITKIMLTITVVYVLSFTPAIIVTLWSTLRPEIWDFMTMHQTMLCEFFLRFYLVNNICNPFIYGFWDKRFKREIVFTFRKIRGKIINTFS